MNSVLITGGAGFLGSSLALAVRRQWPGATVTALDNLRRRGSELNLPRLHEAGVRFVHGDIRNPEDLEDLPPAEFLLECSAEPSVLAGYGSGPRYVLGTNLLGTINCLEYARRHGAKVVFFSTSRVYPIDALNSVRYVETDTRFAWTDGQDTPGVSSGGVTEDFPLRGARSLYGMTKLASEMLLEEYAYAYGLRYVVNRCGVLAGPWQMGRIDQGIIAFWVLRHLRGEPLDYIGFGARGKQVRDFLHVEDLARLVLDQIERFEAFEGEVFNVGGGLAHSVSLQELTEFCREATGNEVAIGRRQETRTADIRIYVSDCAKLFERTAWRPARTAKETVEDIARWLRGQESKLSAITAHPCT